MMILTSVNADDVTMIICQLSALFVVMDLANNWFEGPLNGQSKGERNDCICIPEQTSINCVWSGCVLIALALNHGYFLLFRYLHQM